ncbi:MAG: KUP system potassium uptake protein [Nitriliruptoraceae bacterium]
MAVHRTGSARLASHTFWFLPHGPGGEDAHVNTTKDQPRTSAPKTPDTRRRGRIALLGALGIVYGDIGTSPLYAMREAFAGAPAPGPTDVLGVTSLIVWSLIGVVSIKYLMFVLRADDHGEGGIIALQHLALRGAARGRRVLAVVAALGMFGTALLYGDGMITPAISVLSAVEGLEVVTASMKPFVLPIAIVILIGLFAVQRRGTGRIGAAFGPVMVVWFGYLAASGAWQLAAEPGVLMALDPLHGIRYLFSTPRATAVIGAVFLAVTGSEALYADLGHFGRRPIARSWSWIVFPALLLQYLGQGALLLHSPELADALFYRMAPAALLPGVVVLATAATIIASQALISGAFSLTAQAVRLDLLPYLHVVHTSDRESGQVYVPAVNWLLMVAAIALVIGFGSSTRLASAYGVAVVLTMVITTGLFFLVARDHLGWSLTRASIVCGGFLVLDLVYLVGNVGKVASGGWFPLVIGGGVYGLMATWRRGRALVHEQGAHTRRPLDAFVDGIVHGDVQRVPGTAVYLHRSSASVPPALLTNLRRNHVMHERVVIVQVVVLPSARVPGARRDRITSLGAGVTVIELRFGFAERPNIPRALSAIVDPDYGHLPQDTIYVLGQDEIIATPGGGMALWREHLFATMHRNASSRTNHFALPADRSIRVGRRVEI